MEKSKLISVLVAACMFGAGLLVGVFGEELVGDDDEDEEGGSGDALILDAPYDVTIDPADFVSGVNNTYLPLVPGTKMVYEGETEDGTERVEVVVTNETREVMGVTCVVVRDTVYVGGEIAEDTYDWFAQDVDGNVWYFGEDSWEYEDGERESNAGSWEAGVDGALPGIVMLADPYVGLSYRQEFYSGEAEDMATVLAVDEVITTVEGTHHDVLVTMDFNPLEPGVVEHKYYAPGLGFVREEMVKGGSETVELIEVITV